MNKWIPRSAALVAALAMLAVPLRAQHDKEKKKRDPEVKELIDKFDDAIKDTKFEHDGEAVGLIDRLLQKQEAGMHPKDEHDLIQALGHVFTKKPRKPEQPGLYKATVTALGTIGGEEASRTLVRYVDRNPIKKDEWRAIQEDMYENIGRTKDEKQVDFLVNTATRSPYDGIKKAAGGALRFFKDSDLKLRQEIFKKLLIDFAKIEGDSKSSLDTGDSLVATRKATYRMIMDPWNVTLAAMSGQSFRTAEEWQHWYNKNKDNPKAWK